MFAFRSSEKAIPQINRLETWTEIGAFRRNPNSLLPVISCGPILFLELYRRNLVGPGIHIPSKLFRFGEQRQKLLSLFPSSRKRKDEQNRDDFKRKAAKRAGGTN